VHWGVQVVVWCDWCAVLPQDRVLGCSGGECGVIGVLSSCRKVATLQLLAGYLGLAGDHVSLMIHSLPHLSRLVQALSQVSGWASVGVAPIKLELIELREGCKPP